MKKLKRALVFLFVAIAFLRVEEYIIQGKDSFLINPDPDSLYKKRNFAKQGAICAVVDSNSGEIFYTKLRQNFPKGKSIRCSLVEKMPLFTRQK